MKKLFLLVLPIFLISCSSATMLLNSLNEYKAPLYYLHDSKVTDCEKTASIKLNEISSSVIQPTTTVEKINRKIIPLIFYNYEEVNLDVKLGQNSLSQDYNDFFKQALKTESKRTGCFTFTDTLSAENYVLEIAYDTSLVNSKYQINSTTIFLLLAYSMSMQELGSPAITKLRFTATLKKGGNEIVFTKNYLTDRMQPFITTRAVNPEKLKSDFLTNMAESLALSTKDCIEQLVQDINTTVQTP